MRQATLDTLEDFKFKDYAGDIIIWTPKQIEIIDCILNRSAPDGKKRVQIIAATRWGKSLATGAGVVIRASTFPEKWAIVAGTSEKARIIMEYVIMFALSHPYIRSQLPPETSLDRLRMKKSQDRLSFRLGGEVRVFSADARKIIETSTSLMGFGAPNVIGDESALIPDMLQATIMRMLGDKQDNFLIKIGNPFHRNHFLRTWQSDRYYKIFVDYLTAIKEGRFTQEYITEMMEEPLFDILYECKFPAEGRIDEKGWIPLLLDSEVERAFVENDEPFGEKRLGGDIAGGGRNYSVVVIRGYNVAKKIYKENEPDTMKYAGNIVNYSTEHHVASRNIFVDNVGVGKGAYDRLREVKGGEVVGVSGGQEPANSDRFLNLRAEVYWRAREWILHGGKLEKDDDWYQLSKIKYKVADSSGRIKIMSKEEMLQEGIDSPDVADAFVMTFARVDLPPVYQEQPSVVHYEPPSLDPYSQVGEE